MAQSCSSRIKPIAIDTLETFGLPSKGDTRLNDFKTQENYYTKIRERYIKFCADAGSQYNLEKQFTSLSLFTSVKFDHLNRARDTLPHAPSHNPLEPPSPLHPTSPQPAATPSSTTSELSTLLSAMRKLREAIVATSRHDLFAQRAYIFMIRAAILASSMESYHAALLYLLQRIHPKSPLPATELHEFLGYHILDLCCRQQDYAGAYAARVAYKYVDARVDRVLSALVHGDWVGFWKMRRMVDGYQRRLMEWAEGGVRMIALKCLAMTYFTVEKGFVERSAEMEWEEMVKTLKVGWVLDGGSVVIRKAKVR